MRILFFLLLFLSALTELGFANPSSQKKARRSSVSGLHRKAIFGYVGRAVDRVYPLFNQSISIKGKTITMDNLPQRPLRIALAAVQVSESLGSDIKGFIQRKMLSRNYRLSSGHWLQFVECLECSDLKFSELEGGALLIDRGGSAFPISQEAVKKYNLDYYLTVNVAYNGAILIYKMSIYDANTHLLLGSKSDRWWVGNLQTFDFQSSMYFIPYFSNAEEDKSSKFSKMGMGLYLGGRLYRAVEIGVDFLGVVSLDKFGAKEDAAGTTDEEPGKQTFQWAGANFSLGIPFWEYTRRPIGVIYPVLGFFLGVAYQNAYTKYNGLFFSYGGFFRFDFGKRIYLMLKWMSNMNKNIESGVTDEVTNEMFPSYISLGVGVNFT